MPNILDYIEWRGDISLDADPLNYVDMIVFCQLSYIDFKGIIPILGYSDMTVGEATLRVISNEKDIPQRLLYHVPKDREIVRSVAVADRYKNLKLLGFADIFDESREEQFSAMAIELPNGEVACIFRGTDWSLVGWKEDFNMALSMELPAQLDAVDFLIRLSQISESQKITVMGHSKGGHLAVYASVHAPDSVKSRIKSIISLDGPGLSEDLLKSEGCGKIADRVLEIVPESSIIGSLFDHIGSRKVVVSDASLLMQHDLYTWQVRRNEPEFVPQRDNGSIVIERALNGWIASLDPDTREKFIEGLWSVFADVKSRSLDELFNGKNTMAVLRSYTKLDEETKKLIGDCLNRLRKETVKSLTKRQ